MYTCSSLVVAVVGVVHMPVTVVQPSAFMDVAPIQVNAGFPTKRTPALPAVPAARRTFIDNE